MNIACIACRLESKRFPGKALVEIEGQPAIAHLIKRLKQSKRLSAIILCTADTKRNYELSTIAKRYKIDFFMGDEHDVMKRFLDATAKYQEFKNHRVNIVRVTGDDILIDPVVMDEMIDDHNEKEAEYTYCDLIPGGTETEIIALEPLKCAYRMIKDTSNSEYLTDILKKRAFFHPNEYIPARELRRPEINLTLDYETDLPGITYQMKLHYKRNPYFGIRDIVGANSPYKKTPVKN